MLRQRPFRFLHAADLSLEKQVTGVAELPTHLVPRLADAPRLAAERVFHAAIAEQVDFVLLSGNLLNPYQTGPWGPMFLVEQFQKLNDANIPVYWATGKTDVFERWPVELPLPSNVTLFSTVQVDSHLIEKDGVPLLRILGQSRVSEHHGFSPRKFIPDDAGLFTVAVANGKINPVSLRESGIHYWALGGMTTRHTSYGSANLSAEDATDGLSEKTSSPKNSPEKTSIDPPSQNKPLRKSGSKREFRSRNALRAGKISSSLVHYPGVTLARTLDETGYYGATLAQVDEFGKIHLSIVSVSPVRFVDELVHVESIATVDQLKDDLRDRLSTYQGLQDDHDLYLRWTLRVSRELETTLRHNGTLESICKDMRREFGMSEPFAWLLEITLAIPETFPSEYYEQETILGDYLRKFRRIQTGETGVPALERYLPHEGPVFPVEDQPAPGGKNEKKHLAENETRMNEA
ncbi:MAG: hypothetical protein FWC50_08530, partial [Planctomycetaceae bacterium]|nr:hypothetical protein [Planctomycetaceae bacterium]